MTFADDLVDCGLILGRCNSVVIADRATRKGLAVAGDDGLTGNGEEVIVDRYCLIAEKEIEGLVNAGGDTGAGALEAPGLPEAGDDLAAVDGGFD